MNLIAKTTLPLLASALLLAAPATAQRLSVTLGAQGSYGSPSGSGYGSIGVSYGSAYGPRRGARRSHRGARHATGVWIPGRHLTRYERVWISGTFTKEWVSPVYRDQWQACGPFGRPQKVRVLVRAGYWRKVMKPGRYETRPIQVWVPGHWA